MERVRLVGGDWGQGVSHSAVHSRQSPPPPPLSPSSYLFLYPSSTQLLFHPQSISRLAHRRQYLQCTSLSGRQAGREGHFSYSMGRAAYLTSRTDLLYLASPLVLSPPFLLWSSFSLHFPPSLSNLSFFSL